MANEFTYRADHIGGLIPPAALSDARQRYGRGEIDLDRLREAETVAVKSAADMQRSVGLSVTTDGGFRRADHAALKLRQHVGEKRGSAVAVAVAPAHQGGRAGRKAHRGRSFR